MEQNKTAWEMEMIQREKESLLAEQREQLALVNGYTNPADIATATTAPFPTRVRLVAVP